ncbi:MAG: hypothetical protein JM58_14685 [Peptococcaceae bacterium BICA1-8]|nr:MAG: hypothetical protein JM58_14685 [Peptococcaceae bacterium BICA1-8]
MGDNSQVAVFNKKDFFTGISFLVISLLIYIQTTTLPPEAALFPRISISIISLTGIVILVKSLKSKVRKSSTIMSKNVIIAFIGLLVTYFLLKILGFYSTVFLFILFMFLHIKKERKLITVLKASIFSLFSTIILYLAFYKVMSLMTPTGLLF